MSRGVRKRESFAPCLTRIRLTINMTPKTKLIIAGTGVTAALYGMQRMFGGRRIHTLPYGSGIKLKRSVTINRPVQELYQYWRDLNNLPHLFDNVASVEVYDETVSHWTLKGPANTTLSWEAEITIDRENEMIGWRSLEGADIANAGYVRFDRSTGDRGAVVRVALQYNPPAGKLGAALATVLGAKPNMLLGEGLRRFKQLMEAGEIAKVEDKHPKSADVEIASDESFPASDAPAWTGTTGPTRRIRR